MSTKHWPGPWTAQLQGSPKNKYGVTEVSVNADGMEGIATVYVDEACPELCGEPNARLIAAAPELYEALKEMTDMWLRMGAALPVTLNEPSYLKALRVIAKAEGGGQ